MLGQKTIEEQINRLMEIEAFAEVNENKNEYRNQLFAVASKFHPDPELSDIGLKEIILVDYRLSSKFLVAVGGIYPLIVPDDCTQLVSEPGGIKILQIYSGDRYAMKLPAWVINNLYPHERPSTIKEGLSIFLHYGEHLFKASEEYNCEEVILLGSQSKSKRFPCLRMRDNGVVPTLGIFRHQPSEPKMSWRSITCNK